VTGNVENRLLPEDIQDMLGLLPEDYDTWTVINPCAMWPESMEQIRVHNSFAIIYT
jgi:hypothetical protein